MKQIMLMFLLGAATTLTASACGKKSAAGGDGVGVAECDKYLESLTTCADKLKGPIGDGLKRQRTMLQGSWAESAKNAQEKEMLPKTCADASVAAKKQFADCSW